MGNGEVVRSLYSAFGLAALLVMLARPCLAENNSNYIFNGTTTNIGGTFIVGNTGTNNSLQILNGGAVTNTDGYLGYLGGGDFNTGLVTDPNSIWYNSGSLWVGYNFARTNTLTIANQGRLVSNGSGIGAGNDGNGVIVTGTGSVWTNTGVLYVGYFTPRNYLTVTSTGKVVSTSGVLYVGYNHNSNQLTVSNGGQLDSSQSYVGSAGSYNQALVTGSGSVWNSSSFIQVGATLGANRISGIL